MTRTNLIRVLCISKSTNNYQIIAQALDNIKNTEYQLEQATDYDASYTEIKKQRFDAYIIDFCEDYDNGLKLIKKIISNELYAPVIVFTEEANEELDILSMKEGASDYIVKSEMTPALLERSIRYSYTTNEALKQLAENEYKFRGLFEKSVDAIFILSREYSVMDINHSFQELMGYGKKDMATLRPVNFFQEQADYYFFIDSILKESPLKGWEVVLLRQDGKKLECQMAAVPIYNYENEITGYQCIIHDLSQRKKAERELLHAELLSVTGKMARTMAHEVRNPLTNLTLSLEQLKSEYESEDALMMCEIIGRNAKRIDNIISQMLNNATLDKIIPEPTPPHNLIESSLETVKDRLMLREIKLTKEIDDSLPNVSVDAPKIHIALTNLLVNAIEAMEDKKGHLKVAGKAVNGHVLLEIIDNGKGMDESTKTKLFNPFFTKKHGGTGLGLTNTKNIINAHSGEIHIESEEGVGTSFIISLPVSKS